MKRIALAAVAALLVAGTQRGVEFPCARRFADLAAAGKTCFGTLIQTTERVTIQLLALSFRVALADELAERVVTV